MCALNAKRERGGVRESGLPRASMLRNGSEYVCHAISRYARACDIHIYIYIYTYIHPHSDTHICTTDTQTHAHTCIHIYMHTYIHAHMHRHLQ